MGIYDREYYRREGPSILNAFAAHGKVCKWLIGLNILAFLLQTMTGPRGAAARGLSVTDLFVLDAERVWQQGEVWRLLTYAFLHDTHNIWDIVMNMAFLWWLGSDMEDLYGPREFLAFYLTAALAGGVAFVVFNATEFCLGASGAVMAVSVLCAFHYPTRTILVMFILPMQLWLLVLLYVLFDAWSFLAGTQSGTAVTVHLAGAAFGMVYYKTQIRLLSFLPSWSSLKKPVVKPRLRVYREEEPVPVQSVPAAPAAAPDVDEQLEAKLDAVLEKVARFGQSSLTESERQILFRASEVYKRRRTLDS